MAIKDLFFSIFASDKTGTAFDSVNNRLRETEGVAARLNERVARTGKAMQKLGAVGTVASAGIAALFRGSLDAYDQQARAEAKVAQAIRATGGAAGFTAEELYSQASALQRVTRFGDEDILNKVTAQFLTFKNVTGDVFLDAQKAALDLSTTLSGDVQSASIMLGKALNDPAKGISALTEAGVTFSESQRDVIRAMQETGDLAGAQRLILDEIASAYGGQAEAAREAGAGMRDAWRGAWGDIKEVVGSVQMDALKVILPPLQALSDAFQDMTPRGQRAIVMFGALAVAIPPVVAGLGLLVAGVAAIGAPIALAVAGFAALTAGVVAFWPEIKAAAHWMGEGISAAIDTFTGAIDAVPGQIEAAKTSLYEGLVVPMKEVGAKVGDLLVIVRDAFTAIPEIIGAATAKVVEWINGKFLAIMDSLGQKVEWVEGKFAWLYDKVVGNSWVPDLVDEIGQSFALLDGNMVKPTRTATDQVNSDFQTLMGDVGSKLGDLAASGELTWKGFMGGLLDVGKTYADRIIGDVFDKLGAGMSNAMGQFGSGMSGGGASGGGLFGGFFGSMASGLGSWVGNILGLDTGGSFTVGGRAGIDRNLTVLRTTEGEDVNVTRRGEGGATGAVVNVYIQTPDPQAFSASRAQIGGQISRAVAAAQRAA